MDKETQEKIDIVISNAITDGRRKKASSVETYRIAIMTILEGEGYRKLPKDKPPLLSNEYQYRAQWGADIEWYEGVKDEKN